MSAGGAGGTQANQSGCSQLDEFNKAFNELLGDYEPENFFQALLVNSIGSGIGVGLKKLFAGLYNATGQGISNLADGVGSGAAGVTGGTVNSVTGTDSSDPNFGLSAADVAAIAA